MCKRIVLLILFIIGVNGIVNAQHWSKEDSIWLRNVLEREEIEINEDTKKAIEEGRLIVPSWMKNADNQINKIELLEKIEETQVPDSFRYQNVDPYSMPPAVFALYVLYLNKIDSINENRTCMLSKEEKKQLESLLPTGTMQALSFHTSDYSAGGSITTDFNHILSMALSPSYRNKVHNAKHANAYKNYYDADAIRPTGLTEREKRQLRQAVRNLKVSGHSDPGIKRNGIDD
jgi:hypothetical protein